MKYIIFKDNSIKVFDDKEIHFFMAEGEPVLSAGFYDNGIAFGQSTTLGVKSRPEDTEIIKKFLNK